MVLRTRLISDTNNKIDILLNTGDNTVIIVECKTKKDKAFSSYSAVSRQIKSYCSIAEKKGYRVIKALLVSPEFSQSFIDSAEVETELNLSLIKSSELYDIHKYFTKNNIKSFPTALLLKNVEIDAEKVIKGLEK